jgi:hypothetical protein
MRLVSDSLVQDRHHSRPLLPTNAPSSPALLPSERGVGSTLSRALSPLSCLRRAGYPLGGGVGVRANAEERGEGKLGSSKTVRFVHNA